MDPSANEKPCKRTLAMAIYKPKWFSDHYVMVSTAPTCGLTKGGRSLKKVDPVTARRVQILDPETGALLDAINDQLLEDMQALLALNGPPTAQDQLPETLNFVPEKDVSLSCAVPVYYDHRYRDQFRDALKRDPTFKVLVRTNRYSSSRVL